MEPRILVRTHYQAHEPAYLELLVARCTSATVSAYKETILDRLVQSIPPEKKLNRDAAGYVVDAAHGLGLLTDRYTWAPTGTLMALTSDFHSYSNAGVRHLEPHRRLAHLRVFLGGDGAAIWYLLGKLQEDGMIESGGAAANEVATSMFLDVYRQYLELSSSPKDRIRLRGKMEQLRKRQYRGNTGRHKLLLHVNLLRRLGWLNRQPPKSRLVYSVSDAGREAIDIFFATIGTIADLERRLRRNEAMTLASQLLSGGSLQADHRSPEAFASLLTKTYERVAGLGFSVVPIALVVELLQHYMFTEGIGLSYESASERIEELRRAEPRPVRYHVDRKGRPSYLIMGPAH